MSINRRQMKKMQYVYTKEYYSAIKNNAICRNMNATRDDYNKQSKSQRERQITNDITYLWNLKYDTKEIIYKTETDVGHRKQTCGCQGGGSWGRNGVGGWG